MSPSEAGNGAEGRWAWADVDLDAVAHNVRHVMDLVAPAEVRAVVKADGYGHGAVRVAEAALDAGATGLCVALVQEGVELRRAGIDAPVLLLSEQPAGQVADVVEYGLTPTVYTVGGVRVLAATRADVAVHVKIDTGMQRVGVQLQRAREVIDAVTGAPNLRLEGLYTHLAIADEPADEFTSHQLAAFDELLASLDGLPPVIHAANSTGAIAHVGARRSFVRLGIAMYGVPPGPDLDEACADLRPAMSLKACVSYVKQVAAGSRISYGLRHSFPKATTVATVPIGYADGVPRRLSSVGGEVLVGGRRRRIVGVVTMDQLMVDCDDDAVEVGDEVVLIGQQGDESITAEDWARPLGTIGYEIVCGIGARVPRRYHGATTH